MANETVDIADLIRFMIQEKKKFFKVVLAFIGIGVLLIFLTRNHYSSTLKFIAQTHSKSGNFMGQLGGLSGLNLGNINSPEPGSLSPQLYKEIVYSYPFLWRLSQKTITSETEPIKLGLYVEENRRPSFPSLVKKYTIGLPKVLFGEKPKPLDLDSEVQDSLIFLNRELVPMFNEYRKIISLSTDTETGSISIEVQTLSPEVSAQVAAWVFELLSEYVIEFKTEKALQNMKFVEARFEEAKEKFYEAQNKLSNFRDRNQNLSYSTARAQEERLQSEYNLANNLYNNLAVQLDQAKIKVQEDIPQLTVINPPVVSYQVSKPNVPLIMALSVFMGIVLGFTRLLFLYFKNQFGANR